MRVCLLSRNRFHSDRKALVSYRALASAGHDVVVVAVDSGPPADPVAATVSRRPGPANRLGAVVERLMPVRLSSRWLQTRLARAAAATGAHVYVPLHESVLEASSIAARSSGGVVLRRPDMDGAGDVDLIDLAPSHPGLTGRVESGSESSPGNDQQPGEPEPGRYRGQRAVICYRKTEANPGRYLEAALEQSGFDVQVETDAIDLDQIDEETAFVIFVESPYPAIDVTGTTSVPILFWVHHGEHHLAANLRLTNRYRADAVLLAHSWHLALWFPAPVYRLPFAVAPELSSPELRLEERPLYVAMVGSKLRGDAWQYRRRREMVEALEAHFPAERVAFVEGIPPEEMGRLYGNARIVLNEGGVRHYPITMRVFEAVGSGAALLTDPVPGLETLFEPGVDYSTFTGDVVGDVERLLGGLTETQAMADHALETARSRHTYDHRVDQLVAIAQHTPKRNVPPRETMSDLARLIDRDVEVQRIVHDTVSGLADQLPDREVWPLPEREGRLGAGSMDAAVVTSDGDDPTTRLLDSARRYIYASGPVTGLDEYLATRHPEAIVETRADLRRVDLIAESYRTRTAEGRSR